MCRHIYLSCTHCGARRFLLWEECAAFWQRYQYIVIDRGNFDDRPRLGRKKNEPPACGGKLQDPKFREFPLGKCPRFPNCPSLQRYFQERNPRRGQQQQPGQRGQNSSRLLTMGHDEDRNLRGGDGGESGQDRQKREFAERWFQKRPLTGEQHAVEVDGAADATSQDGNSTREYNVRAGGAGPSSVMDSTLSAPTIPRTMYPAEDVAQSMGSTVIESGSEVESCDWNEMYQSIRGLKIDSANSI